MDAKRIRMTAAALGGILIAAGLGACVESGKEPEQWMGVARNTCGPADGPALEVVIRETGTGGCADTGTIQARLFLDRQQVDSLGSGKSFLDSEMVCQSGACQSAALYRLQIESADGKSAQGILEVREKAATGSETVKRVHVDLTKCPSTIQMCG
ncbi:MAG: hypothetical protein JF616_15555 [Fibrobacteres bacterium]|jgi:hypothetical protein|nr:hypothetical protein [Fibrobacterota bacterium]